MMLEKGFSSKNVVRDPPGHETNAEDGVVQQSAEGRLVKSDSRKNPSKAEARPEKTVWSSG